MTRLRDQYAIVGVAECGIPKAPGETALSLQCRAARLALLDAGLQLQDIDGVFAHTEDRFSATLVAEYLGIFPHFADTTNIGGASNIAHIAHAMAAIDAGFCTTALICYGSMQASDGSRKIGGTPEDARTPRGQFITPYGQLTPIGFYAMLAQRHMAQYGTTPEQLAEVAVAARQWAMRNPAATRREPMSVADVLASPMVASPLHLRDCCLVTDGAGALIVTSMRRARDLRQPLVQVLGIAEGSTHHFTPFAAMDWLVTGNASSGERAFAMAQVKHADLDVVEIYDSFTITVLQTLEDLGFCGRGEGGAFVSGGRIAPGGDLPLNTSGGGLSYCHPGMFGTFVAIEGVRQLRGECGERQVPDAKLALCHGTGGVFSTQATMIIARD